MSFLNHAPGFSREAAERLAAEFYGIHASATPLPSERDQNFLLQARSGEKFVFKIANAAERRVMIEAENRAMNHVAGKISICPRVVPTPSEDDIVEIESSDGVRHLARLLTYLPGIPLGRIRRHSPELLRDFGRRLGQLSAALADFDHPGAHRSFHWDLAGGVSLVHEKERLVSDPELRKSVVKATADFERTVAPLLPTLPKSVIHNDANDYNVLVERDPVTRAQSVVGLIDFGDMVHGYTVGDLAVAVAYAVLDKPDPLAAAARIVAGRHAEHPLDDNELAALFGLIRLRLGLSICIAAEQHRHRPDNEYLVISQQPIRRTLPKLDAVHPRLAEAVFRDACGLKPVPRSRPVVDWLKANTRRFAPVLDPDVRVAPTVVFDLSVGGSLIRGDSRLNAEPELTRRLFEAMKNGGATVGIGRYDEARLLYTGPAFAGDEAPSEPRTIHLGVDLFAEAGTPIFAPLAGTVHAFNDNDAPQDYGPVVILRHQTDDGSPFFTLYGHLSRESLDGLSIGKPFGPGDRLATVGDSTVNGGWTPHLHFQVVTDLLDLDCEFPGVGRPGQRAVWRDFSPDPNLILGVPEDRFPPRAPSAAETLAARRKLIGKPVSVSYREPIKAARGWMQYLFDEDGRRYLDAYNNVPHVGHCRPEVVRAGQEQMAVLNTNTRYLHDAINRYAERLTATLPSPLGVCFFLNSASEANELALRLARAYTGRRDMIVLEAAYHGHTTSLIDISPYKHDGPGGEGAPAWVHAAPIPDTYRGPFKKDDPRAGEKYARAVSEIIDRLRADGGGPAGFIAESLPSVGGQIVFPPGYLSAVYAAVRAAGGVCIADEVQTGYGRIGTHFWGFQSQGVVPDIVVLGKPIGNGHPIGAVVTTPEIAAAFDTGMEFFSTFGGNPVSCAIGLAVLDIVLGERLQAHALRVGDRLLEGLRPLARRFPLVGDVRGSGLFLGVELVRDRETLEPAAAEASFVVNRLREHLILTGTDGPHHNVLKIRPPMPFSEADADRLVAALESVFAEEFE